MPNPTDGHREGAPRHIHVETKRGGINWLAWLLLALGILALLFALSRCDRNTGTAVVPVAPEGTPTAAPAAAAGAGAGAAAGAGAGAVAAGATGPVLAATPHAADTAAGAAQEASTKSLSGLPRYLAGNEPTPRTFTFDEVNFDFDKSAIRAGDKGELDRLAALLKSHPNARIGVAGHADSRGTSAYNRALGKRRADSIKAALVDRGIAADRIATASAGESDPIGSNINAAGRAENRRTELVVTRR